MVWTCRVHRSKGQKQQWIAAFALHCPPTHHPYRQARHKLAFALDRRVGTRMKPRDISRRLLGIGAAAILASSSLLTPSAGLHAQGWWPWSQDPPRPREPVYRPPPVPVPPAATQPQANRTPGSGNPVCLQLEQRLVAEGQRGNQGRSQLPRIDEEMRQLDKAAAQSQSQLERGDCYEYFLFSKSLRRSPQCIQAANQLDASKRRLSDLSIQRQQIMGSSERSFQDDIIRELARNGCGPQYVQEARKRDGDGSIFGGLGPEDDGTRSDNSFGNLPFATYRTVCVRLCDGYFFPVSFSTLPNHFARDADQCQSRCAAPVELYYHQNPGGDIRQAVSAKSQTPYTTLKSAFKYTKEYVHGCSCKEAEYVPAAGEKRADAPVSGQSGLASGTSQRQQSRAP